MPSAPFRGLFRRVQPLLQGVLPRDAPGRRPNCGGHSPHSQGYKHEAEVQQHATAHTLRRKERGVAVGAGHLEAIAPGRLVPQKVLDMRASGAFWGLFQHAGRHQGWPGPWPVAVVQPQ